MSVFLILLLGYPVLVLLIALATDDRKDPRRN